MPKLARTTVCLALALAAAATASWFYSLYGDPETKFWAQALRIKQQRVNQLSGAEQRVFFIGGSSCAFGINARQLDQDFGIQACNLGVAAAAGRLFHSETGMQPLREGDVLVVAFETNTWSKPAPPRPTPLGAKLWFGTMLGAFCEQSLLAEAGLPEAYSAIEVRPGGYHCVAMVIKLLIGKRLYPYVVEDIDSTGYMTTELTMRPQGPVAVEPHLLSPAARSLLEKVRDYATGVGASVVVHLPWQYVDPTIEADQRTANRRLILDLEEVCPVLDDKQAGVLSDIDLYADTVWHLNRSGARRRTAAVGAALSEWLSAREASAKP